MIEVTNEFIDPYIKGKKRYSAYDTTVDIADHLKFHIDGYVYEEVKGGKRENPYFNRLIDRRRPSESDHIQEYRRFIYLPITKQPCFKVLNSLKKGVKATDWKIDFAKADKPSKVREGEHLEDYATQKLPFFKSVESWFYSYSMKEIIADPNGLICVLPKEFEVPTNTDFRNPYPYFIPSEKVYDFLDGEYAVFETSKTYEYYSENRKTVYKDNVLCIVTKTEVWEVKKTSTKGDYEAVMVLSLNFNEMPVFRGGGLYKEIIDNSPIYDSFISPIIPGLDAAARESSDLDAEVVQHIFSTMWYYASQGCATCAGTGSVIKSGKQTVCGTCEGNGVIAKSPYKDLVIKTPSIDDQAIKPPFAGYIEKNTEIVKIQDERINAHVYKALSGINMEFLAETPLNQSGKAKEVDKDELNNFVYGVYYHFVENVLNRIYKYINEIRVMGLGLTEDVKSKMLPKIQIPERFEILSENYLQDQIVSARTGNLDPLIVSNLELDFVNKKFENMPEVRDKIRSIKDIDPFPAMSNEDKDNGVLNGTLLKEDVILSKYINYFVELAINEVDGFLEKDFQEKVDIVKGFAQGKITQFQAEQKAREALLIKQI